MKCSARVWKIAISEAGAIGIGLLAFCNRWSLCRALQFGQELSVLSLLSICAGATAGVPGMRRASVVPGYRVVWCLSSEPYNLPKTLPWARGEGYCCSLKQAGFWNWEEGEEALRPLISKPGVWILGVQLSAGFAGRPGPAVPALSLKILFVSARENSFKSFGKIWSVATEKPCQLVCLRQVHSTRT